jgi:PTH1 family peptidyl-tRNA hydrolase
MNNIIIGLGNPGEEYAKTYHNAGKLFLEWLIDAHSLEVKKVSGKHFAYAKSPFGVLILPQVYMNESGEAAAEALKFFESDEEHLIVVHDDSDLGIGSYKYVRGGGSAGHHGIESLVKHLHGGNFYRIRIGIRNPDEPVRKKAGDFVLHQLSGESLNKLHGVFGDIKVKVIENEAPFSSATID